MGNLSAPTLTACCAVSVLALLLYGVHFYFDSKPDEYQSNSNSKSASHGDVAKKPFITSTTPHQTRGDAYPSEFPEAPRSELDDLIRNSKLSEYWLTTHGFGSGDALQRLHELSDGRADFKNAPRFTLSITPEDAIGNSTTEMSRLAPQERYVHATLAAGTAWFGDSVLVRWRNVSSQVVMELSSQAVPADSSEPLHLWIRSSQDWSPGRYRLEVISGNPQLELIASAEFEVASDGAPITAFSFPVGKQ